MSDGLHRDLAAEAGIGAPPELDSIWLTGRKRRRRGRQLRAGGAVAAVALVVGAGAVALRPDDGESVRAGAVPEHCDPAPLHTSEQALIISDPAPQPPRTPEAMVHGGGSEALAAPDVVARVRVLAAARVNASTGERRSEVEVLDPVLGAETGDRFTVSDLGEVRRLVDLERAQREVERQIAEFQLGVDEIDRPLAELDAAILALSPDDPRYQELLDRREQVKRSTDADRDAAVLQLNDLKQRQQLLEIQERLVGTSPAGTACHAFAAGDDLVVALVRRPSGAGIYELTGPSSFFLVDGDGFSAGLDAARRAVPGWDDSPLLELARESTPDEFVDRLRAAN